MLKLKRNAGKRRSPLSPKDHSIPLLLGNVDEKLWLLWNWLSLFS